MTGEQWRMESLGRRKKRDNPVGSFECVCVCGLEKEAWCKGGWHRVRRGARQIVNEECLIERVGFLKPSPSLVYSVGWRVEGRLQCSEKKNGQIRR